MKKMAWELVREFAIRRMSLAEFHTRQSSVRLRAGDTPALLVSDQEKSQFSGWKNATELAAGKSDADIRINWGELVEENRHSPWIWVLFGVVVVAALGALMLGSQIDLAIVGSPRPFGVKW
jgi:hypothetical protein